MSPAVKRLWSRAALVLMIPTCIFLSRPATGQRSEAAGSPPTTVTYTGYVYVMNNRAEGNQIIRFGRAKDGMLTRLDTVDTGGLGGSIDGTRTHDPLSSQDSVVLSADGTRLVAVNAGSNEISVIGIDKDGMHLLSVNGSGGLFPTTLAMNGNLVYAANVIGDAPNIAGFHLDADGKLVKLASWWRAIPGSINAGAQDIRFTPDGTRLVVTDESLDEIDVFEIGDDGSVIDVKAPQTSLSGPFGIRFGRDDMALVADAKSDSVSSFRISSTDGIDVVDNSVANGQKGTCWIALTASGGTAFVSNTDSRTVSSYSVAADGHLALAKAAAATLESGSAPTDIALSPTGDFLYVEDSAKGRVLIYKVKGTSLVRVGQVTGIATSMQGIAVD
jgi:6-phosphogluconolactonase